MIIVVIMVILSIIMMIMVIMMAMSAIMMVLIMTILKIYTHEMEERLPKHFDHRERVASCAGQGSPFLLPW